MERVPVLPFVYFVFGKDVVKLCRLWKWGDGAHGFYPSCWDRKKTAARQAGSGRGPASLPPIANPADR